MIGFLQLLNSFDQQSKEFDAFLQDLLLRSNDLPFDSEEVNSLQNIVVTAINSRMNQESTRFAGLLLLDSILSRCSKDVLIKYGILWISKATNVVENIHSSQRDLALACKVLGSLIAACKEIPELQKQVSMQSVKQLLNVITDLDTNTKSGALYYLVASLLYYYPEICERYQGPILTMVLHQLDSTQANLINSGAKCYALLAKATERSFVPPSSKSNYTGWIYNQALICNSLHLLMDDLFAGLVEIESADIWCQLDLPEISEENVIEYYDHQKQRFINLCTYLSTMLRGYKVKNSTCPADILQILCRGLAITPANLKKHDTVKQQMLYLILPKLHMGLLNVLNALIVGFRQELVPYGSIILQLFRQTLQWTGSVNSQVTISESKPYRNLRISTYKCLSTWLTCNHSNSGIGTMGDECLSGILKDIIPKKDCVMLTVQKPPSRMSKRALKRFKDSQYEKGVLPNKASSDLKSGHQDIELCKEALIVLENTFFCAGTFFKSSFIKTVQNTIVPLLYDHYLNTSAQNFYKSNVECRLYLLKLLKAMEMNPHNQTPSPTQYSIQIFEMALNDDSVRIRQEAKLMLAELEKIVHPSAPTLQLSRIEDLETTDATAMNGDASFIEEPCELSDGRSGVKNKPAPDADEEFSSSKRQKVQPEVEDVPNSMEEDEPDVTLSETQMDETPSHQNDTVSNAENATMLTEPEEQEESAPNVDVSDSISSKDAINDEVRPESKEMPEKSPTLCEKTADKTDDTVENQGERPDEDTEKDAEECVEQNDVVENDAEEEDILLSFHDEPKT